MGRPDNFFLSLYKITIIIIITTLNLFISKNEAVYTRQQLEAIPDVDYNFANAVRNDIFYYFYQNSTQIDGILIDNNQTDSPLSYPFNQTVPTKFFFHGYTSDYTSPWYPLLKEEYFKKGQHNIFYVDWSKAGNLIYQISSANIKPVGEFIADFIIQTKLPLKQIHLIGHSLGSPLAAFVGKAIRQKTGHKIGRITALDAVGPGFDRLTNDNLRLCKNDAEFVDVYHTDIDYYGHKRPIGDVDFYINGGKNQPGCDRYVDDNCSHARSTLFYIESIGNTAIRAKQATYIEDEIIEIIDNGDIIGFGDNLIGNETGVYFVGTSDKSPFFSTEA